MMIIIITNTTLSNPIPHKYQLFPLIPITPPDIPGNLKPPDDDGSIVTERGWITGSLFPDLTSMLNIFSPKASSLTLTLRVTLPTWAELTRI